MGGGMAFPDFRPRKCGRKKKKQQLQDRISCLPDDILVYILSLMRLEDAMRTSVLSKRWIDLWKFVPRLDFDSASDLAEIGRLEAPQEMPCYLESTRLKCQKYVSGVNKALQSHKSMDLEIFRICFSLDCTYKDHIDKWFQYAFARKVERLEFSLCTVHVGSRYAFPRCLHVSSQFKSLKALTFAYIEVSDKIINYLLQKCPSLEYLALVRCICLKRLQFCGTSLALKQVEIISCFGLDSLEICDLNIVSLKTDHGRQLLLKNVPRLVDVLVGGTNTRTIELAVSCLSCVWSQLEVLTLRCRLPERGREPRVLIPQFPKLKKFTVSALVYSDFSNMEFTNIMRAAPNLETFILEMGWRHTVVREPREHVRAINFPLEHLEEVELRGYYGRTAEVELVEYLLQNAVNLRKIVVDPLNQPFYGVFYPGISKEMENSARMYANHVKELIPSHVDLVIL